MEYSFNNLSDKKDYKEVIDLLFLSDKYIYKDLFGSLENAYIILPVLIDTEKSIFSKDNIFVLKVNGDIVGMVSYYKNNIGWNENRLIKIFYEKNLDIPESFYSVSKYFDKLLNYPRIGDAACSVVVKEKYRNKGYATYIIKQIIDKAKGQDIVLDVLADNTPAINLYFKNGFKILGQPYDDYGGHNKPPVKCFRMYYPNDKKYYK